MAYRNGTYVAFHAGGTTDPTATKSDIKYFNTLKMWHKNSDHQFRLIDSHEKTASVRDSSKKLTLETRLRERLNNSKNMLLIVTGNTINDTDWVPFEIEHAVDSCRIPIIAAYPNYMTIKNPKKLGHYWPSALKSRINNGQASVIHIPFKQTAITDAIDQFGPDKKPAGGGLGYYSDSAYKSFGLL